VYLHDWTPGFANKGSGRLLVQGSHGHGKSLNPGKINFPGKSWKIDKNLKVLEKSILES